MPEATPPTQRWKITIEYDGGPYHGWQKQKPHIATVQTAIEKALFQFCQQHISVHAAGRTDAGVHAKAQIAHFDLSSHRDYTGYDICKAINAHLLPNAIAILKAEKVDDNFHARFGAKNKLYSYRIVHRCFKPVRDLGKVWHIRKLMDIDAMIQAAPALIGHHDFSSFRDSHCQAKSPVRTLDDLTITHFPYDDFGGTEIIFDFKGQSFLHHQIRNMVGTLSLVGTGKWQPEEVKAALEAKDRKRGGPTAPPDGLYLIDIDYTEK